MCVTVEVASAILQVLHWMGLSGLVPPNGAEGMVGVLNEQRHRLEINALPQNIRDTNDDMLPYKIFMLYASLAFNLDLHLVDAGSPGEPSLSIPTFFRRRPGFAAIPAECDLEGPVYLVLYNERVGFATGGWSLAFFFFFFATYFF